jgi:hypothetical protein
VLLLRGIVRLSRRGRSLRAVRLLLLLLLLLILAWVGEGRMLLLLLLRAKLVVWGWLLMRAQLGVWCSWLLLLLRVGGGLWVSCGVLWGRAGRRGLLRVGLGVRLRLLRRVHLRLVLLLVGVLGLGGLGSRLRAQHWRALRLHLDGCVVG